MFTFLSVVADKFRMSGLKSMVLVSCMNHTNADNVVGLYLASLDRKEGKLALSYIRASGKANSIQCLP